MLHRAKNININSFAMQEIWQLPYPDLFKIDGYTLYTLQRKISKGGGVGFYIDSNLPSKIHPGLTSCVEKIFECLTIETVINKQTYLLSNIYRSPSNSQNDIDEFLAHFDGHLNKLSNSDLRYVIMLDKIKQERIFNTENKTKFRDALNSIKWINVLRSADVDVAFEEFWEIFYPLFELYFPLTTVKFNKMYIN